MTVLDASVLIAHFEPSHAHHARAGAVAEVPEPVGLRLVRD